MPELRRDPIIGRWVIISTERGKRPTDYRIEEEPEMGRFCPFCEGHEDKTPPEILAYGDANREKNKSGWRVRVVPNKFPVLQIEGGINRHGDGMYDKMNGIGAHEVLIESPQHNLEIPNLEDNRVEDIFWAFRDRIIDLRRDVRFEYILIFKNKGAAAGASLTHPHSQLIATPMVPVRVRQEIQGGKQYFEYKERCIFCDMVAQELASNVRVVAENDQFVAFEPFAARFPFETWILPKNHDSHFEDLQKSEALSLSKILKKVLTKIKIVLDDPPYNYIIHNSPLKDAPLPHFHWHIEIMPKLSKIAGFEWGTGFYINPTPPEEAAQFLKEAD
ncbi:MAG: galactose-1-phosphate uridylyltransferase [Elusimicrobia bacterium]|nr:galactose-1-phosphate uridylyltransferase [Elusimicrobiota bacterium]